MARKVIEVKVKNKRQKRLLNAFRAKLKRDKPSIEEENLRAAILYDSSTQHT